MSTATSLVQLFIKHTSPHGVRKPSEENSANLQEVTSQMSKITHLNTELAVNTHKEEEQNMKKDFGEI